MRYMKYPELETIVHLPFSGNELVGVTVYWTEKRDGSNLAIRLESGELKVGSRNQPQAAGDITNSFKRSEEFPKVEKLLKENTHLGVYGEMLIKGKSPTKIELHEKDEFVIFDIFDFDKDSFIPFNQVQKLCKKYKLPIVDLWIKSKPKTLGSLLETRDKILEVAKLPHAGGMREGTVLKAYPKVGRPVYAKEKIEWKIPGKEKKEKPDEPYVPPLNDGEIFGAIDKAFVDLGLNKFKEVRTAMPLVAKYTREEAKKHRRKMPHNLFKFYQDYLQRKLSQ